VIHHLAKGLHPRSQAKQLEARRNLRQGLKLQRSRRNRSRCSKLVHGVAFLCGITTPSLAAQGEQRRFSYFNIERDNFIGLLDVSTPILGPKLFSGKTDRGLGLPEGPYTSHVLLTYVAELLGEDEDWLPTITRPPGDRVIGVIEG
jgi:hypothetical protein